MLDVIAPTHPNVSRSVEYRVKELGTIQTFARGNFLQHLKHAVEINPHDHKAADPIRRSRLLKKPFNIGCTGRRSLFPRPITAEIKIFVGQTGKTCLLENAAKQVCAAALDRGNDVCSKNRACPYWEENNSKDRWWLAWLYHRLVLLTERTTRWLSPPTRVIRCCPKILSGQSRPLSMSGGVCRC